MRIAWLVYQLLWSLVEHARMATYISQAVGDALAMFYTLRPNLILNKTFFSFFFNISDETMPKRRG